MITKDMRIVEVLQVKPSRRRYSEDTEWDVFIVLWRIRKRLRKPLPYTESMLRKCLPNLTLNRYKFKSPQILRTFKLSIVLTYANGLDISQNFVILVLT